VEALVVTMSVTMSVVLSVTMSVVLLVTLSVTLSATLWVALLDQESVMKSVEWLAHLSVKRFHWGESLVLH
jgi:hypothetical protein